jgi:FtsZ-interacting cell division protein ZipA
MGAFEKCPAFNYNQAMYRRQIATGFQLQAWSRLAVMTALLSAFWSSAASAATVYKTVDDNGVVSYSDTPPVDEAPVETLVIDVRVPELDETAQEQLEAMRETTDKMVADRQQREKHRAEMRQQQPQSQAGSQVAQYTDQSSYSGTYSGYYPYPVYRPGRRPRPGHPIVRPPLRPHNPVQLPAQVISPGHNYPASLVRRGYSPPVRAAFEK